MNLVFSGNSEVFGWSHKKVKTQKVKIIYTLLQFLLRFFSPQVMFSLVRLGFIVNFIIHRCHLTPLLISLHFMSTSAR